MLRLYGATGLTPQALLSWALAKSFQIQELPEIEMDLNRPFAFLITGVDGLPLFIGTVNTLQ